MDEKEKQEWAKKEAQRLGELIANSKTLSQLDMQWFDVLYGIDSEWSKIFSEYRNGNCSIEEALIKGVLYFAKNDPALAEEYKKLSEAVEKAVEEAIDEIPN